MAASQCLEDSPLRFGSRHPDNNLQEVYDERHRLALEELLAGGVDGFLDFLKKEKVPNFLSEDEIQRIRAAAVPPRCSSGEDPEQSLSSSVDCSSVTYFPEVSDVEPPLLEMGWPAFTAGSYRGVTRAVAHFQPGFGENIYCCKEAARRMIRAAREVIAIVTDTLTDLDVFKDLQEACYARKVPVYILLDQTCCPAFLKMCRNIGVSLDDLLQMRVRTITGTTYYMRSGARITGRVHERFMLIDGHKVATGSYRFNWTDGKLNSSNLIELSGQITEKFDEEFRILYAQSLPINTRGPPGADSSGVYEHLLIKHPVTSSPCPNRERPPEPGRVAATRGCTPQPLLSEPSAVQAAQRASLASDASTIGEEWLEEPQMEEILAGSVTPHSPAEQVAGTELVTCHTGTQTTVSVTDSDTQTDLIPAVTTTTTPHSHHRIDAPSSASPKQIFPSRAAPGSTLKGCFHQLNKERQQQYSSIRFKLEHMMTILSQRRQLADITNVTNGPRAHRVGGEEPSTRPLVGNAGMGMLPRARCVH